MDSADNDIDTVEILFEKGKYLHGLFFFHSAVEKALKSYVVKITGYHPPKTHKLEYLANKINLDINQEKKDLFADLMDFQIDGRYPDYNPEIPNKDEIIEMFTKSKETIKWLKKKLEI
jgi:HEPN domain-containing protein